MQIFDVDKKGLAKLLERRGISHILNELYQNAVDANGVKNVHIVLYASPGRPAASIRIEDDSPHGFKRLSDAYTLFAPSERKADAEKRGRYGLGEKLVIALCHNAKIVTTTGTVFFSDNGRTTGHGKTDVGSIFEGSFRATRAQIDELRAAAGKLIVPDGIRVTFDGDDLQPRVKAGSFEVTLDTEVADAEGVLRRSPRKTTVELYEPRDGEVACVYELGIPIVETGDKYHYNVLQKVPLSMERDNVTPAYLRALRTFALNATYNSLTTDQANQSWARDAASDKRASDSAILAVAEQRFGDLRASYDPSDPEANATAGYRGHTVITGSQLSADEWENFRRAQAIRPAGQIFPTPKPYGNGPLEKIVPEADWTDNQRQAAAYAKMLAKELMGVTLFVRITKAGNNFMACYGSEQLTFNINGGCTPRFFANVGSVEFDDLMIHELAHQFASDHRSPEYHGALTRLGAKLKRLALDKPEVFK